MNGIVYIGTTNDTNGNPRRGWIVGYGTADAYFVDEGYEGRSALREALRTAGAIADFPAAGDVPRIDVSPSQYRYWLKRTIAAKP